MGHGGRGPAQARRPAPPQAGTVHQLAVHTVGGVINNGETIMQIVPRADELVVEAKVAPFDIDQIATGATCGRAHHVRQPASGLRACPLTSNGSSSKTPLNQHTGLLSRFALPADEVARLTDIHRGLAVGFVGASEGVGRPDLLLARSFSTATA